MAKISIDEGAALIMMVGRGERKRGERKSVKLLLIGLEKISVVMGAALLMVEGRGERREAK